jgi:hypothetical protein
LDKIKKHFIWHFIVIGILSVVFMPVFWLSFRPEKDIAYHFGPKKPVVLSRLSMIPALSDHFTEVGIKLKTESITILSEGRFDRAYSFICLLDTHDFPVAIHFVRGSAFERLSGIHEKYLGKYSFSSRLGKSYSDWEKDVEIAKAQEHEKLAEVIRSEVSFKGHLYSSKGFIKNFGRYQYNDEDELIDYFNQNGIKIKSSDYADLFLRLIGENEKRQTAYILSVEEKPSLYGLWESRFAVFSIMLLISIITLIILIRKLRYRATPLIRTIQNNNTSGALKIIHKRANIDAKDNAGCTALMWASAKGNTVIIQRLLESGADINSQGFNQMTSLMFAAGGEQYDAVKLLLLKGADMYIADSSGFSAYDYSVAGNYRLIEDLFIKNNYDTFKTAEN